jgi:hypothetical protein
MELLPADVRDALTTYPIDSQDGLGDQAKVVVKFFFPAGRYTLFGHGGTAGRRRRLSLLRVLPVGAWARERRVGLHAPLGARGHRAQGNADRARSPFPDRHSNPCGRAQTTDLLIY